MKISLLALTSLGLTLSPICQAFVLQPPSPSAISISTSTEAGGVFALSATSSSSTTSSKAAEDAFEQTKRQYQKLQNKSKQSIPDEEEEDDGNESTYDAYAEERTTLYQQYIAQPANTLKEQLKSYNLKTQGRKPDLARRLADYDITQMMRTDGGDDNYNDEDDQDVYEGSSTAAASAFTSGKGNENDNDDNEEEEEETIIPIKKFAKLQLSEAAGLALARAQFTIPTSIQQTALPLLTKQRQSIILHAETGSGKTLCYLLPITERLWSQHDNNNMNIMDEGGEGSTSGGGGYALIMTPTRELAAQVAGIATVLSPPNTVRLITTPTNLVRDSFEMREKSEMTHGGRMDNSGNSSSSSKKGGHGGMKLIVGSAKSIMTSAFGNDQMSAPPTSKPEAKEFLSNVKYLVLDEVDRLLNIKTGRKSTSKYYKKHEKPAAMLTSTITRLTLGQVQLVAASATVGRPLRREYARVLGLLPNECPPVIRGHVNDNKDKGNTDDGDEEEDSTTKRAITVPKSLKHFVMPSDGSSGGGLLTTAAFLVKSLPPIVMKNDKTRGRKILFVISNASGMKMQDTLGALRHFNVKPDPKNLLDVLGAEGTDNLIGAHREVSQVGGLGETRKKKKNSLEGVDDKGYILVTGEDTVRGLHLDELDSVVIVGRPKSPDDYIHIAGRAGRAGKKGNVLNVLSYEQAGSLSSWSSILDIDFEPLDEGDVSQLN